jgi:hypothetical protein
MSIRHKKVFGQGSKGSDLKRVLHRVVRNCNNPAHLLEVYYWSLEPELAEVMRQFIALPESSGAALCAFLSMTKGNEDLVSISVSPQGDITLSSPAVSELMKTMEITTSLRERIESVH